MNVRNIDVDALNEILTSYKWIKVKKFTPSNDPAEMIIHHVEETEFLIAKCRELAKGLLDLNNTHSTLLVALDYNRKERDELKAKLL